MSRATNRSPARGAYCGTEVDGKWWKRYRKHGFFARGSGKYWYDTNEFCFLRTLTRKPLRIPFSHVLDVEIGKWHAGQWRLGRPILKVIWEMDGRRLSSGFIVSSDLGSTEALLNELRTRINR